MMYDKKTIKLMGRWQCVVSFAIFIITTLVAWKFAVPVPFAVVLICLELWQWLLGVGSAGAALSAIEEKGGQEDE